MTLRLVLQHLSVLYLPWPHRTRPEYSHFHLTTFGRDVQQSIPEFVVAARGSFNDSIPILRFLCREYTVMSDLRHNRSW